MSLTEVRRLARARQNLILIAGLLGLGRLELARRDVAE